MNRWLKAFSLVNMIILAGCSTDYQASDLVLEERALMDKAVVVTRIHAPHQNMVLGATDSAVCSVWQNEANPEIKYNFRLPGLFTYFHPADLQTQMVVPGTYSLKSMKYKINGTEHDVSFSKNTQITFTASAGEVVYIGDIEVVNPSVDGTSLKVVDNQSDAEKQLQQDVPGLNKPLVKRLVKGIY